MMAFISFHNIENWLFIFVYRRFIQLPWLQGGAWFSSCRISKACVRSCSPMKQTCGCVEDSPGESYCTPLFHCDRLCNLIWLDVACKVTVLLVAWSSLSRNSHQDPVDLCCLVWFVQGGLSNPWFWYRMYLANHLEALQPGMKSF